MPVITVGLRASTDAAAAMRTIRQIDPASACRVTNRTLFCQTTRPEVVLHQHSSLITDSRWLNINMEESL